MDLLTCVNFPTHLRRAIHTQTLCLAAQCVLCDGLCNGVAAILGNHRAADGRQHVFSISPLPAGSTLKFSSSGQFPKSPLTLFHCCNTEVLTSAAVFLCGLPGTAIDTPPTSSPHGPSPLCAAPYKAQRLGFVIMNIRAEAV